MLDAQSYRGAGARHLRRGYAASLSRPTASSRIVRMPARTSPSLALLGSAIRRARANTGTRSRSSPRDCRSSISFDAAATTFIGASHKSGITVAGAARSRRRSEKLGEIVRMRATRDVGSARHHLDLELLQAARRREARCIVPYARRPGTGDEAMRSAAACTLDARSPMRAIAGALKRRPDPRRRAPARPARASRCRLRGQATRQPDLARDRRDFEPGGPRSRTRPGARSPRSPRSPASSRPDRRRDLDRLRGRATGASRAPDRVEHARPPSQNTVHTTDEIKAVEQVARRGADAAGEIQSLDRTAARRAPIALESKVATSSNASAPSSRRATATAAPARRWRYRPD